MSQYVVTTPVEDRKKKSEEDPTSVVNLYEVLDDRFAHEGCRSFLFFVCFFFFIFHLSVSASNYADVAAEKSNFKDKLIVPSDQFERKQFNAWALQLMRDLANDPKYFGDKFEVMRMTALVQTKLCSYEAEHPKGSGDNTNYENGAPKWSFVKSYENVCPVLSSGSGRGNDRETLGLLLKDSYKLYTSNDVRDHARSQAYVPIFSAEINESNKTNVASEALTKLESALADDMMLELSRFDVEILNPFDHIWYYILVDPTDDKTSKRLELLSRIILTIPQSQNTPFVLFFTASFICQVWLTCAVIRNICELQKRTNDICLTLSKSSNGLYLFVVLPGWFILIWLLIINFGFQFSPDALMKHPRGTLYRLEDTTQFIVQYRKYPHYLRDFYNQLFTSILLFFLMIIMVKELSWHSGTSVLTSTLKNASAELMDTLSVVMVVLVGFGGFSYNLFGAFGGSRDFQNFMSSANTIARLSFGLYDYDEYISGGLGPGYEGIGLGNQAYWSYITLWISFIILSTVIVNILIAIVSDGYETHKKKKQLRVKQGESIVEYTYNQLKYILIFCSCCCGQKRLEDQGVKKLCFTWSKHSKSLLKYCDTDPDCMVFDDALQKEVFKNINGKENIEYTKEKARDFFSNLQSKEKLQKVIEEIIKVSKEKLQKVIELEKIKNTFEDKDVYKTIWDAYKQPKKEVKEVETDLFVKQAEWDTKVSVRCLEEKVNKDIAEMKGKIDRILKLLEER